MRERERGAARSGINPSRKRYKIAKKLNFALWKSGELHMAHIGFRHCCSFEIDSRIKKSSEELWSVIADFVLFPPFHFQNMSCYLTKALYLILEWKLGQHERGRIGKEETS